VTGRVTRMVRRVLAWLTRVASRLRAPDSPWQRVPMHVSTGAFGPGSRSQFAHYFEGESRVAVSSIDDIVEWLRRCEYVSDLDQFHEEDVWQHPGAFEQVRRGDCEDFALWAWRKLTELGIDAEFYVGRVLLTDEPDIDRQHAWIVYRVGGTDFLFEPAARSSRQAIRRLGDAMDEYVPHFAVNRQLVTSAFVGCVLDSYRRTTRGLDRSRAGVGPRST
jgi:hypothetical protein